MPLLRRALLRAARSPRLRRTAERSRVTRPVVDRFVAGTDEHDAIEVTRGQLDSGLRVTLDYLGEDTVSRGQAEHTVSRYLSLLASLGRAGLADRAEVSLKLSAIGQALAHDGRSIALDGARQVCAAAAAVGTTVTLDMEDHTTTDSTLAIHADLRADFPWVGAVLQAYLKRTEGDCRDLAVGGARVRLCKGAYAESASIAHRGRAIDEAYLRCLDVLFRGDAYPMIATHDPALIDAAREEITRTGRNADSYEFQMLYGVRPDEQNALASAGHRVRVYLPYGNEWYGYFLRRLAERPANVRFFLRALRSRS